MIYGDDSSMQKFRARIALFFLQIARNAIHPDDRPKACKGTMSAAATLVYKYDL